MKDTNDALVTATLIALANLVPLLGSDVVIGGKRAKLFNDGRPNDSRNRSRAKEASRTQTVSNATIQEAVANPVIMETNNLLSERPRPDGEEDTDSQEVSQSNEEDLEKWDDWNTNENSERTFVTDTTYSTVETQANTTKIPVIITSIKPEEKFAKQLNNKSIPDISELDIKNQVRSKDEDIDFFEDMVPVINNSNKFLIDEQNDIILEKEINNKLAFNTNESGEEGWCDDWD